MHLLVGACSTSGVQRQENISDWLSLGKIVAEQGVIPEEKVVQVLSNAKAFKEIAKKSGAERMYFFGTEALRRAANHDEVMERLTNQTGLEVDLISPIREAELALTGSLIDMSTKKPLHFVELGGGSAQIAHYEDGEIITELSLPIGTGVLSQRVDLAYPAAERQVAEMKGVALEVGGRLHEWPRANSLLVSGGVARGIWRALHPDGQPVVHIRELEYLIWDTQRLKPSLIESRYGVKTERAQTLLPGAIVYRELMRALGHQEMKVSLFGVREGALMKMRQGEIAGQDL